jgi:hypothetical protein
MRDPQRIRRITDKLYVLWLANPDWRFGQLVSTFMARPDHWSERRLFFQEDEVTEGQLDEATERWIGTAPKS